MKAMFKTRSGQIVGAVALVWHFALVDWLWTHLLAESLLPVIFLAVSLLCLSGLYKQYKQRAENQVQFWAVFSLCIPVSSISITFLESVSGKTFDLKFFWALAIVFFTLLKC